MIKIDEKMIELAESYYSHFGEMIPLRMLPDNLTYDQLYGIIQECIDRESPDLIENYYEKATEDILL